MPFLEVTSHPSTGTSHGLRREKRINNNFPVAKVNMKKYYQAMKTKKCARRGCTNEAPKSKGKKPRIYCGPMCAAFCSLQSRLKKSS